MSKKQQSKVPPLTKGPVPLAPIRDNARAALLDIVDSMIGAKALVLDPTLDCFGLMIPAAVLSEHGVVEMSPLREELAQPQSKSVIYIARANVVNARRIADQIKTLNNIDEHYKYAVYFVPRSSHLCDKIFEEEGIRGDVVLGELPFDFIPFDEDVLSLELHDSFKETIIDGDPTSLYLMARALIQLQTVVGTIPRMIGKGEAAEAVKDMCTRMSGVIGDPPPVGAVKKMILLDRAVDLVTPFVTQVTYEGMVDEILGIKNNAVEVDVADRTGAMEKRKYFLNSSDHMHAQMRDVPWHKAAPQIREWVQKMQRDWNSLKKDVSSKSVSEMREFGNRLLQLGSTEMHSDISEPIAKKMITDDLKDTINVERQILEEGLFEEGYKYAEEKLFSGCDFYVALRLLCLLCITNNGIPKKIIDSLRKTMLLSYGHENLSLFNYLEKAGMLYPKQEFRTNFPTIRRALNLSVPEEDETTPRDVSHIYWGYAPISIRLVELTLRQRRSLSFVRDESMDTSGWKGKGMDAVNLLPGPHFDESSSDGPRLSRPLLGDREEAILVVFIGGVTFSEISSLRFLSNLSGGRTKFIVATSHIMNGTTMLKSFQEENVKQTMLKAKKNDVPGPLAQDLCCHCPDRIVVEIGGRTEPAGVFGTYF